MEWKAYEYHHEPKGPDWFWALGILALAGAVTAVILGNILFGIFLLLGAFAIALFKVRPPELLTFKLTDRGIVIGKTLYPYQELESFWVFNGNDTRDPKLLIKSKRMIAPQLTIPITEYHPSDVRGYLKNYLPEEEMEESLMDHVAEFFGF